MENSAAIRATFCNLKNIAGRKVVQVICEVPVEQAGQVYEALGWPDASNPKWVAIAMLNLDAK
jgi:hypothetical protein